MNKRFAIYTKTGELVELIDQQFTTSMVETGSGYKVVPSKFLIKEG